MFRRREILKIYSYVQQQLMKKHALANSVVEPVTDHNKYRILEDIITPFARISYEKQLLFKNAAAREDVKQLVKGISSTDPRILPMSPSPVVDHYRSKDEFNVQMGNDGDPKTFGFFIGNFKENSVFAVRPTHLRNVKPEHKRILHVFEEFVRKSALPPCYRLDDGGYWRQIVIRSNLKGESMVIIVVHPQNRTAEEINKEREDLVKHFIDNDVKLHSLYHQLSTHVKGTEKNSQLTLIHGVPYIYEEILQRRFRISPNSFFQINVKATEVLHDELAQLAQFKSSDTLLDLCCGVGTFSISYADYVRNCVGIEQSYSALNDALNNCSVNNATNCFFTLGKLEERLKSVYGILDNVTDLVVIVNPGRGGIHTRVVEHLLQHPLINKLFLVSCDPRNIVIIKNVQALLEPKSKKIKKFVLKTVKPVDLFPHTIHYEMIMHFER